MYRAKGMTRESPGTHDMQLTLERPPQTVHHLVQMAIACAAIAIAGKMPGGPGMLWGADFHLFARAHTLEPVPDQRVILLLPARIRIHTGHRIRDHVPEITERALPGSHARDEQLRDGGGRIYVRADLKRLV